MYTILALLSSGINAVWAAAPTLTVQSSETALIIRTAAGSLVVEGRVVDDDGTFSFNIRLDARGQNSFRLDPTGYMGVRCETWTSRWAAHPGGMPTFDKIELRPAPETRASGKPAEVILTRTSDQRVKVVVDLDRDGMGDASVTSRFGW